MLEDVDPGMCWTLKYTSVESSTLQYGHCVRTPQKTGRTGGGRLLTMRRAGQGGGAGRAAARQKQARSVKETGRSDIEGSTRRVR